MARPVWTPTDAQRRQAEMMAAYGIPEADIARVLGVSSDSNVQRAPLDLIGILTEEKSLALPRR
jgi:hypothetical protein